MRKLPFGVGRDGDGDRESLVNEEEEEEDEEQASFLIFGTEGSRKGILLCLVI